MWGWAEHLPRARSAPLHLCRPPWQRVRGSGGSRPSSEAPVLDPEPVRAAAVAGALRGATRIRGHHPRAAHPLTDEKHKPHGREGLAQPCGKVFKLEHPRPWAPGRPSASWKIRALLPQPREDRRRWPAEGKPGAGESRWRPGAQASPDPTGSPFSKPIETQTEFC